LVNSENERDPRTYEKRLKKNDQKDMKKDVERKRERMTLRDVALMGWA